MSFLGKLKTAIKGNPVLREYEVGKHVASAGPALLWKIHDGIKKATKQEVSVFIFNKQTPELEKLHKKDREALFEMMKQGPTHLAKLRHPKILTIDHQVEESRYIVQHNYMSMFVTHVVLVSDCIAFATEPVFTSLANALGHYDNLPSPLPLSIKVM
jgi:SCY1-like protein 2